MERDEFSFGNRREMSNAQESGENNKVGEAIAIANPKTMPPTSVMTRLILIMVWRKLIRNPNTYSSLIGLTWSLISFRYETLNPFYSMLELNILSSNSRGIMFRASILDFVEKISRVHEI